METRIYREEGYYITVESDLCEDMEIFTISIDDGDSITLNENEFQGLKKILNKIN